MGWRYLAERLDGAGGGVIIEHDLPLIGATITDNLSGPARLTGTLAPEIVTLLTPDGKPTIDPWSVAIWAEEEGTIRGGGLLTVPGYSNQTLSVDCLGMSGYPKGMPYTDSNFWVGVDPMDMARVIWAHLQSQPMGNLGVVLDGTTSPIRIGTELTQVEFDTQSGPVSFEAGPYKLAWYQTFDLGQEFDSLASDTPFDYRDRPAWDDSGNNIVKRIELGYPRIGARRTDLRFVVGENVSTVPDATFDDDYANAVLTLGAGTGSSMVTSGVIYAAVDGRIRRVAVVQDSTITSKTRALARSNSELAQRTGEYDVTQVVCVQHKNAPIGSVQSGDDIYLESTRGWAKVSNWFRVLSVTLTPENGQVMTLSVVRSDKVTT